jgi:N-methylhydantoinase B
MIRASTSMIVKEGEDCSAAVFDGQGRLLSESATIPIHLNCTGVCLRTILDHYVPADEWRPGDIIFTNDPYAGPGSLSTAHVNDYVVFTPCFFEEKLVGFAGLMVHHSEIGQARGWNAEIYQEGMRVPPMKIGENNMLDPRIMAILLNNTRRPDSVENDMLAQCASVHAAADELQALFTRYGTSTLLECFDALIDYSEQRTRAEISAIPDGVYHHEEPVLDDGASGGPHWLRLKLIKKGSELIFDFTGTDPTVKGPINSPLATTWSAIFYTMRCITDPSIPSTEGCKRPFKVVAPLGTLVNAAKPAAVYQRMVVCHSLVDLIMGALADAIPDRVMADSCGCLYNNVVTRYPGQSKSILFGEVVPGGIGATARADGMDVMSCHVTNCRIPPIEATEAEAPVLYLRREMRSDTGGAGKWRGGVGQVLEYRLLGDEGYFSHTSQKAKSLPQGFAGGAPGDGGGWTINAGKPDQRVLKYSVGGVEHLRAGDTVTHCTPAGGGYGDAMKRDHNRVIADVRAGLVSIASAEKLYGVRLDPSDLTRWHPVGRRASL